MNAPPDTDARQAMTRRPLVALAEIGLVFGVFFIQGAWPVPDVNEPYYLGKAIHHWDKAVHPSNPQWIPGDFFLDSADTHQVFYFTFGWLSLWLPPTVLAWTGRVLTWGLLAWAWRRLSVAVVPRPWMSVLTAALLVGLVERFHMAGEWLIGGVEAKGFAFVLVFLGLEALVRNRWKRAWPLLGAAASFHVLVGGWSVVAAALAWLCSGRDRTPLRSMWPAVLGGFLLSLPGLIPSLGLTWGVDAATVQEANRIYVFERLAHHLDFVGFHLVFKLRFIGLCVFGFLLFRVTPAGGPAARLGRFCAASLVIAALGILISVCLSGNPALQTSLLRFYWFRLADVMVPVAVALGVGVFVLHWLRVRPRLGTAALTAAVVLAGLHVGDYGVIRLRRVPPRAQWRGKADREADYVAWRKACAWIARPENVPRKARFLTPRRCETFKWYAGRSEVATWKDIPQDAESIVEWWDRLNEVYATGSALPDEFWCSSLAEQEPWWLAELGARYQADYVLTVPEPALPLEVVYANSGYVIYRLKKGTSPICAKQPPGRSQLAAGAPANRTHPLFQAGSSDCEHVPGQ